MRFIFMVLMAITFAAPSFAQKKGPVINITTPPEFDGVAEAYKKAIEPLTPLQKQQLEVMEKEHVKTLEPDIQIFDKAKWLEPCNKAGLMDDGDMQKFLKFRDHQNKMQDLLRSEFQHIYIDKVDFMDKQILRKNLLYSQYIQLNIVGQLMPIFQAQLTPEKLVQECPKAKAYIDNYIATNGL